MNSELGTVSVLLVYGAMAAYVVALIAFAIDVSAIGAKAGEASRRRAAGIGTSVTWLAAIFQFAAIVVRGFAAHRVPWANMYEFTLMFTFFLVATYLIVNLKKDLRYMGVGVAFLAFLALFFAVTELYVVAEGVQPALQSYWLVIHVSIATLATGLFGMSALISIVQLIKGCYEKRDDGGTSVAATGDSGVSPSSLNDGPVAGGESGGGVAVATKPEKTRVVDRMLTSLPSAAGLEQIAFRINTVAIVAWTFVIIAGAVWAEHAWGRPWGWDPKETWSFVIWVIYAAYLHARHTAGWAANKFAYFCLVGFMALLANFYIVNIFFNSRHSYSGL